MVDAVLPRGPHHPPLPVSFTLSRVADTGYSSVVRESAGARDGLYGALTFAFALALVRGVIGASTTAGRIVCALFFGGIVVGGIIVWIWRRRRAPWLEISDDKIVLQRPKSTEVRQLTKAPGSQLRFVSVGSMQYRSTGLTLVGSGIVLPLSFFTRKVVTQACVDHHWEFA
jgi:hypothetical protein